MKPTEFEQADLFGTVCDRDASKRFGLQTNDNIKQNASFTKSANGYYINLPEASTGIFLLRNIKTGDVVKFVKQ